MPVRGSILLYEAGIQLSPCLSCNNSFFCLYKRNNTFQVRVVCRSRDWACVATHNPFTKKFRKASGNAGGEGEKEWYSANRNIHG